MASRPKTARVQRGLMAAISGRGGEGVGKKIVEGVDRGVAKSARSGGGRSAVRVAAVYDIHGNLPALEAVLDDARRAGVDRIVVGGDVVPGPMPREALARLLDLDIPVQFIR